MSPNTFPVSLHPPCPTPAGASAPMTPKAADLLSRVVAARDLDQQRSAPPAWLWHGYLGPGKTTLLTSQWKSGKTTLVSLLLARLQHGGQLAGLPVAAGKAFVISEESEADWRARFQQLGIRDNVDLLCRPFPGPPTLDQWLALLDTAAAMHQRHGTALVVIDSLAQFLPAHRENAAGALLECLTPLQRLTAAGLSALLLHHPRKGKALAGQAARGSGALAGFVDILIEMGYYAQPDDLDRRRRLLAFSRYEQTPRHLLLELLADGTDYQVLQSGVEAAFGDSWQAVLDVLEEAWAKLTRQEILDLWSDDYARPEATTLWRWLSRAVAQGIIRQEGTGRPHAPFRYWLPAREAMLRPDGGTAAEMQAWNDRYTAALFGDWVRDAGATPARETADAGAGASPVAASSAAPDPTTQSPEPLSPPVPEPAAPASPAPAASPPAPADTVAPPADVRLPYPFCIMDPAEVPEEVWQQARAAKRNT